MRFRFTNVSHISLYVDSIILSKHKFIWFHPIICVCSNRAPEAPAPHRHVILGRVHVPSFGFDLAPLLLPLERLGLRCLAPPAAPAFDRALRRLVWALLFSRLEVWKAQNCGSQTKKNTILEILKWIKHFLAILMQG